MLGLQLLDSALLAKTYRRLRITSRDHVLSLYIYYYAPLAYARPGVEDQDIWCACIC